MQWIILVSYVSSKKLLFLLVYLISFCGEVVDSIKHFTIFELNEGYLGALRFLETLYGNLHIITKTNRPMLRISDSQGLTKLEEDMKVCSVILAKLNVM